MGAWLTLLTQLAREWTKRRAKPTDSMVWRHQNQRVNVNGLRWSPLSITRRSGTGRTLKRRLNDALRWSLKLSSAAFFPNQLRYQQSPPGTTRSSIYDSSTALICRDTRDSIHVYSSENENGLKSLRLHHVGPLQLPVAAARDPPPHMHEHVRARHVPRDHGPEQGRLRRHLLEVCKGGRAVKSVYKHMLCPHGHHCAPQLNGEAMLGLK